MMFTFDELFGKHVTMSEQLAYYNASGLFTYDDVYNALINDYSDLYNVPVSDIPPEIKASIEWIAESMINENK